MMNQFPAKYILLHFALYLTGAVNNSGKMYPDIYTPMNRHFLSNLLKSLFPFKCACYLHQLFEKCVESENPFKVRISELYSLETVNRGVDYLAFAKHMNSSKEIFEDYVGGVDSRSRFGHFETERYPEYKEKILEQKVIVHDSMAILEYSEEDLRAEFELVSQDCEKGKHCIIAISGFLSENDNNVDAWKGLVKVCSKYCKEKDIDSSMVPVYAYRWASKSVLSLLDPITQAVVPQISFKGTLKKLLSLYQILEVGKDYRKIFTHSVKIAKLSGKLLAHALMLQFPFVNQSISLIGFSLGAQVIYSCLEELKKNDAYNIINNVYFLGAAISVESADEWMSSLSVVRGVVTNAYCKKDYILQLYKAAVFKNPIGLSPLLLDNNETPENHFRINNCDVTNEAQGHTYYRERLERILDAINFNG